MMKDDGEEHLLGTLLSQCRSLCDACVEVVACRKNVVTHMKRKHTEVNMYDPLIRFCWKVSFAKKVQSRTTAARHQGLRASSVHPSHNGGSWMAIFSTLVPLLSLLPLLTSGGCKVHRCTVLQFSGGHIWGMAISLPPYCMCCPVQLSSPLPTALPCTHLLPIPSSKSQIEADCKSDWLAGQIGQIGGCAGLLLYLLNCPVFRS